ncbi:hypothetical protein BO85DRAFT_447163 [Aspergillus piperis CBS 112811]|uniref:Fungal calcium binding protein domain-containing protein n=1 Tax=Aspergillus piperis CBS 112811 TaxID=1448313 RepID=A0A8G1R788_9EURO|nr:hypothetical protein BO85DRAFT_447163 [Aspergillus piperis CBS 112811]RAH60588.1 hypothetical protein BO85DRAFT_447163 [Aspergillus piperis CBS 112811]
MKLLTILSTTLFIAAVAATPVIDKAAREIIPKCPSDQATRNCKLCLDVWRLTGHDIDPLSCCKLAGCEG